MSRKLNNAIKYFKEKDYIVEKIDDKTYRLYYPKFSKKVYDEYTARQLIVQYRKCSKKRYTKVLKWSDKKQNRAETRQIIHHKQFDKLSKNKKAKPDNIWNWD